MALLLGGIAGGGYWWDRQPKVQESFWDLKIGMPIDEVLFKKGKPTSINDGGRFVYSTYGKNSFLVDFNEGFISAVFIAPTNETSTNIQGIYNNDTYEKIEEKFGVPDSIATSSDKLTRLISFNRYHVFFGLKQNRVETLGIYNPALGTLKLD